MLTESRIIDGKEQTCLILPVDDNQIIRGKWGNWVMRLHLYEIPPNPDRISHKAGLVWNDRQTAKKWDRDGTMERVLNLGRVRPHIKEQIPKVDKGNNAEDIPLCGEIILSDIPKGLIYKNFQNKMRYVHNMRVKSLRDDGKVWLGSICVDLIPRHLILEYPDSGKKYIRVRFKKLIKLDNYMNTHILVIDTKDGSEIEIGRFREFRKDGEVVKSEFPPEEIHDTPVNQRQPESIDGLKF